MPIWPKSIYFIGENLATAGTAWRLRRKRCAVPAQHRTFTSLVSKLAHASFWREAGIVSGMDYETFRSRVPPRALASLTPAIDRMRRGEPDVLWPDRCAFFTRTAGTSTGEQRVIPVTGDQFAHIRSATHQAMLYYTARIGHAGIFRGRFLFVGGSTAVAPLADGTGHEAYVTEPSGIRALGFPRWAERHLLEPGTTISQLANWEEKLAAIVTRTRQRDITLVAGLPSSLLALTQAMRAQGKREGFAVPNLQAIWPNLECCVHTGMLLSPFQAQLRTELGASLRFHDVYVAAEGVIAAQDPEPKAGLRLMTDVGLFFEFVPLAEFDPERPEISGGRALPLEGVKPGVDYAALLTTPTGLVRHVLGDIVRFASVDPPRLAYIGRSDLSLRALGELVTEKEVTDAIVALCQKQGWTLVNFSVAPRFTPTHTGQRRGGHEWWIELQPGTVTTPIGPQMAAELDADLQRANADYAARRKAGTLDPPIVRLVMPGVFEHWLRFHHRWGGPFKTPRCRSDRHVADELAQITNFARD